MRATAATDPAAPTPLAHPRRPCGLRLSGASLLSRDAAPVPDPRPTLHGSPPCGAPALPLRSAVAPPITPGRPGSPPTPPPGLTATCGHPASGVALQGPYTRRAPGSEDPGAPLSAPVPIKSPSRHYRRLRRHFTLQLANAPTYPACRAPAPPLALKAVGMKSPASSPSGLSGWWSSAR